MASEKMHEVTIDVVDRVFDKDMNIVDETRESALPNGSIRVGGTTKLVSVLKAYETVRTKEGVKGNLNNLEIGVDGSPFQG